MNRSVRPTVLLIFFLCAALSLSGCNRPEVITPIPREVLEAILMFFVTAKNLQLAGNRELNRDHRHRGYFVWRRARFLGERNASWVSEANQTTLKNRVDSEYGAVETFLQAKIGTRDAPGPLYGGTDPVSPAHLDLDDVARVYIGDRAESSSVRRRKRDYREARRLFTQAIIWRAAAIEDEIWEPSADGRSATLKTAALNELIDRRLRLVERMAYNVASASALGGARWPRTLPGATGPWRDGFRVRMFEYPRVPKIRQFNAVLSGSPIWRLGERGTRYEYEVAQEDANLEQRFAGIRFPPSQIPHWRSPGSRSYRQFLAPSGRTAAQVIDDMFIPTPADKWEDWWGRTWMWCDHVIAALHLDSLLLGRRRRDGNDTRFNDLIDGDYVSIGAVVGAASRALDVDRLMADDDDPFFLNTVVPVNDLQVGDHLIFWNSFIYGMISTGDWRLENALVMTIDSDPRSGIQMAGNPPSLQLSLQGHGTPRFPYGRYTGHIADKLRGAMRHVQEQIENAVASDSSRTSLMYSERGGTEFVLWSPYEAFASPGAWWIRIPRARWSGDWGFASVEEAVQGIKKSVGHVSEAGTTFHVLNGDTGAVRLATGSGYHAPPDTDSVYFPIYEPAVQNAWNGYLPSRRSGPVASLPSRLRRLVVDGAMMPGIFYRGVSQPVPIVRPKVIN
jgi:hypothetical protein